jgi:hypothetical protein
MMNDQGELEAWLAVRKAAGLKIDPENAEVEWDIGLLSDPYDVKPDPPPEFHCVGRRYFARAPGSDVWVWFHDLPKHVHDTLWAKRASKLAFPSGGHLKDFRDEH